MPRPNYGLDAPTVVRNFVLLGVSLTIAGIVLAMLPSRLAPRPALSLAN